MRAKEFLSELTLNVPDQMVTVQVPLSAISGGSDGSEEVVNPGKRAGEDGKYKWSPPLQQHLDATKDAVGPSNNDIEVDDEEVEQEKEDPISDFKKTLIALLSRTPSALG